jgi:hypothetical protein
MIWSKSRKALEALLADSVKDHVQFHITRYGPGISALMTRAWITWDGVEIATMSTIENELRPETAPFSRWDFTNAVETYLNSTIASALASDNAIIRALAMLDRRTGKRRLLDMHMNGKETWLVRRLYDLRLEAEGLLQKS